MLKKSDPEVAELIRLEKKRQEEGLELIPSENIASKAVLEAMGSVLTNKYAEGYPEKRYYAGNEVIDKVENLAIERAKKLFGAEHVNVQPYSGSPANFEVYFALLEHKDKILAMNLNHGGHLTHGHSVNFSGKNYTFTHYGVDEKTEMLDYDAIRKIALKEKPKLILSGASAYPREIDFKQFAEIAEEVGAISMADIAHIAGLVAANVHQSPFPYTDVVTTTTHKSLRGPRGAMIMCKEKFAQQIDKAVFPGMQGGPHEHVIAAKAVCLKEAMSDEFREYSRQVLKNAKVLADELMARGFKLVTNGTDNHLILINIAKSGLSGKEAQLALEKAGIICNKNVIPFDTRSPFDPSGIRIGTPAITTRGMKESEMKVIADIMEKALKNAKDDALLGKLKQEVVMLLKEFPLPY